MTERLALVTGASRGIGRSVALRLADDGYRVIAIARDPGALRLLQAETPTRRLGRLVTRSCDVRDSARVAELVREIEDAYGSVDVLVSNAGVNHQGEFERQSGEDYDDTFDVNVRGFVTLAGALIPGMESRGGGSMVVLVSSAGLRGFAGSSLYCGSKFALVGIIDALQEELRPKGIRVTALCPGWVNTGLAAASGLDGAYGSKVLQPDDVAAAVAYILDQREDVVIERLVIRSLAERPYSSMLMATELAMIERKRANRT